MPNGATASTIDAACRWMTRRCAASSVSPMGASLVPLASDVVSLRGGDSARSVRRPAASFKVRRRSLSPKRQAEFDEWIQRWSLELEGRVLDWAEVFGRDGAVVLDVGFGHGESTIEMATAQPDLDVIGVEVHTPG